MVFEDLSNYASLTIKIKSLIESAIIKNELKPGERLKETEIGQKMGVSRGPVREAFRLLEAEGLVINQPRKGLIVSPLNMEEVEDIYEIRPWLEGNITRLAVDNTSDRFITELEEIIKKMFKYVQQEDLLDYTIMDAEFHKKIYENPNNQILIGIMSNLWKKCLRYLFITNSQPGELHLSYQKHNDLLNAIKEGNALEASQIAENNINESKKLLFIYLKRAGIK